MEERHPRKKRKIKKLTQRMQARLLFVFCVVFAALLLMIARLVYLGNIDKYEKNALAQQSYVSSVIPYKRGEITDRNGQVLATSELIYHLILDPKVLLSKEENVEPTIKALVTVYGLEEADLRTILAEKPNSSYVVLKKQLSYTEKQSFSEYIEGLKAQEKGKKNGESSKIKGVWFEEEYKRTYPFGTLASHIIGFTVSGDVGTYGIEQQYNDDLIGTNGRTYGYYDSQLNIQRTTKEAEDGKTIVSTIDLNVQRVVQKYVERFLNDVGAENVGVVIMDAGSGEILAMQSNYSYDLNSPRDLSGWYTEEQITAMSDQETVNNLYKLWRNFCISDAYEPGSTFKPFTVAGALEENLISTDSEYLCDGFELFPGNVRIRCSNNNGHGKISLAQSLMYSCNDAMMQIAALEGRTMFYDYQKHFLFGTRTGIDLPGETKGELIPESGLNATELATSSFGQSLTVNMVQIASAFCSLVNGGTYYEPHVVKAVKNAKGATVRQVEPVAICQTVSAETSEFIKEAMYMTVQSGTATKAQVKGYLIGGKTGTAQKRPLTEKKNLVSLLGFVESGDTQIVIYVVVDEAHDEELMRKSATASEMAAAILEEALPYLKVYPEGEINYHLETIEQDDLLTNPDDNPNYRPEDNEDAPNVME